MPQFLFKGRSATGELMQGKREGENADMIANALIKEKIFPVEITLLDNKKSFFDSETLLPFLHKIKASDLIMFCRQMASLYKAGVPLTIALARLAESVYSKHFSAALNNITQLIASGKTLSMAMQKHPKIFPVFVVNLTKIGEASAQLDVAFQQIADYLELQDNNFKRMKAVIRYPLFVITAIVIGILVINLFVIPAFAKMYNRLHAQLPLPTRILLNTSNFIKNDWYYVVAGIIASILVVYYYFKSPRGKFFFAKGQFYLPLFGNILERIMLARVVSTLAITIKGGIPLVEGINLIANTTNNIYIRQRLLFMRSALEQGKTLTQAANSAALFNPLILQMLTVGEETGQMDELLLQVGHFYEQEVDYGLKTLADRLEPFLLVGVAGMVLFLALGVFLPMWNMAQVVH